MEEDLELPWINISLEEKLYEIFNELSINSEEKTSVESFLAPLKYKDKISRYHYYHCIRVGIIAREIARFMHLDEKALFYSGLLHDIGKSHVCLELLAKADVRLGSNGEWTQENAKEMERHVIDGYNLLRDKFYFIAEIIVRHHKYQINDYPKELPAPLHKYSAGTEVLVGVYSRILALADVYDAIHRLNNKLNREPTEDEVKESLVKFSSDINFLVEDLYKHHVLPMSYLYGGQDVNNKN